jgi:uncharacterized protein affecting Mg2+/Co2+ transport
MSWSIAYTVKAIKQQRPLVMYNRLIAILEQVSAAVVALVVGDGVTGEQPTHKTGEGHPAQAQEDVNVIGD